MAKSSLGHILIVDSDVGITELLKVNLESDGYNVDIVEKAELVDRSELGGVSLIIVDSMNLNYSGLDLIYDLREDPKTDHIGIIFYTNFNGERLIIDALDAGADDCLTKPFSLREMVARVRSVMRRRSVQNVPKAGNTIIFRNLVLNLEKKTVAIDNVPVSLSRTEFAILSILLRNLNNYVSRLEIHRSVWSNEAGANERIVDTNISRLRKKLGPLGEYITNRSGQGYMIS